LLSLPDIAHDGIASFLPDGDSKHGNRLWVSEVSRALLGSDGGALTCASLRYKPDGSAARLAALLRRQKALTAICVRNQRVFPALSQAISHGAAEE